MYAIAGSTVTGTQSAMHSQLSEIVTSMNRMLGHTSGQPRHTLDGEGCVATVSPGEAGGTLYLTFLLVDDAERVQDANQSLGSLLSSAPAGLCIIAAGRSADLCSTYSHSTKAVSKARCGVLLQPDIYYDAELLGVKIPRTAPVAIIPGRGYACVSGAIALIQSISPSAEKDAGQ